MATITWTEEAQRWLEDIFEYVAADNPRVAADTVNGIYERAQVLADFPDLSSEDIRAALLFAADRERRLFSAPL